MIMDAKKLSALIREKKNKMLSAEPSLVDTDSKPDMNPNEIYDTTQDGRVEETLDSPHRIDARDTAAAEGTAEGMTVGLTPEEKSRMGRLRKYMDEMD